jgi:hypothetical protein
MAFNSLRTIWIFLLLGTPQSAFAICSESPDQGRKVEFTVEKITRRECSCKEGEGKTGKVKLPGCVIEGQTLPEKFFWNALARLGIKKTSTFSPTLAGKQIHDSNEEEICQKKPGDSITAYVSFHCHDVGFPAPENESCKNEWINAMCAGNYRVATSISLNPPIDPSKDPKYKLSK